MSQPSVLMIEDEKNIVELVKYNLERQGCRVFSVLDGKQGVDFALREKPSLILLDLMLPGMDGLEVCRLLRNNYKTRAIPIIMLTAKSEDADIVLGLEMGADDYVTKPFSLRQLQARIKAVLRRYEARPEDRVICAGKIEMDTARHQVLLEGKAVEVTFKEYGVLKLLMESGGRVLSREAILNAVWGQDESLYVELRVVDKHVGELRRKLKTEGSRIITAKNFGYRFDWGPQD